MCVADYDGLATCRLIARTAVQVASQRLEEDKELELQRERDEILKKRAAASVLAGGDKKARHEGSSTVSGATRVPASFEVKASSGVCIIQDIVDSTGCPMPLPVKERPGWKSLVSYVHNGVPEEDLSDPYWVMKTDERMEYKEMHPVDRDMYVVREHTDFL